MKKIHRQALSIYQLPIADGQEFFIEYVETVLDTFEKETVRVNVHGGKNTGSMNTAYLYKVKSLENIKVDEVYRASIERKYSISPATFSVKGFLTLTLDSERTAKNKKRRSSWLKHNTGMSVPIDNFGRSTNDAKETK